MALNEKRRLPPDEIKADHATLLAICDLPDYAPTNPAISTEALVALEEALKLAKENELRLRNLLAAACDTTIATAWALHNGVLGAKAQVIAQYGHDSNAVKALGLKKKSERRRPARRNSETAVAASEQVEP